MAFCGRLLSLSTFLRLIIVVACICISFLFVVSPSHCVYIPHVSLHSLGAEHFYSFHPLSVTNNSVQDNYLQVFLCVYMLSFFLGLYLGKQLLGNMVVLFNYLRKCQIVSYFYFPPAVYEGSNDSTSLVTLYFLF